MVLTCLALTNFSQLATKISIFWNKQNFLMQSTHLFHNEMLMR